MFFFTGRMNTLPLYSPGSVLGGIEIPHHVFLPVGLVLVALGISIGTRTGEPVSSVPDAYDVDAESEYF